MTTPERTMREAFEAWFIKSNKGDASHLRMENGSYYLFYTSGMWEVWQAASAVRSVERKPLTNQERAGIVAGFKSRNWTAGDIIDAVEAAHGIGVSK